MKKLSLIISLVFSVTNCKGQELTNTKQKKDTLIPTQKSMYNIPIVKPDFETFDFEKTRQETLKEPSRAAALKNSNAKERGYSYDGKLDENRFVHRSFFEILDANMKYIIKPGEYHPLEIIYYNNSPFMIQKTFYPNGNIREKGLKIVKGNIYKGMWYYFDEKGKLIQTIDNDKLFGFKWEQVEKFMEENQIPMILGNAYYGGVSINRWTPLLYPQSSEKDSTQKSDRNLYSITYKGEVWNQYFDVVLDGDTGKILRRTKYWVSEEGEDVPEPIVEDFSK